MVSYVCSRNENKQITKRNNNGNNNNIKPGPYSHTKYRQDWACHQVYVKDQGGRGLVGVSRQLGHMNAGFIISGIVYKSMPPFIYLTH